MEELNLKIGDRLKEIRIRRQMSLENVAELTGVSKPMLGQIERGQSTPTINTLWKIATGLKVPLSSFCRQNETQYRLAFPDDENVITEENGQMRAFPLFPYDPIRNVEIFYIEFDAGVQHSSERHADGVEEYVSVVHGTLEMVIGQERVILNEKQSIRFRADAYNVYLIDSGNDKDAGRKVRQILEKNDWKLKGILNTHSNADHIGGNRYLQNQTGCIVFSGGIEAAFTQYPILEPSFLYGGYPCKDLRHKFLLAQDSNVTSFSAGNFPKEIEIVPLPGHFFDMVGFRTPDQTVFLADCISSKETLEKYAISFIYDVEAYLKTLDKVETMKAAMFVPAHAGASADVRDLIQYNRKKIYEVAVCLREICSEAKTFEQVLQRVFNRYGLVMNFEQYVLVGSTVRSYLSWLKDKGEMNVDFQDNQLLWRSV